MAFRLAVFLNDPECSTECCFGMINALSREYRIGAFSFDQFDTVVRSDYTCIMFPGGLGDSHNHYKFFTRRQGNMLAEYVANGGRYLGICMGAYWAGPWYFDLLGDIDVVQYIKRPNADVRRSYPTVANITWDNGEHNMFFYDGCTYVGDIADRDVVARYSNGDPMAIIKQNIGLIGCHPESELSWYDKNYMRKYWHNYDHHTLLVEFVDRLCTGDM